MKIVLLLALTLIGLYHQVFAAAVPRHYTVTELPTASGANFFSPWRINNHGEILGHLDFSEGPFKDDPHAAFYRAGATIDLHLLISSGDTTEGSLPDDLNDRGEAIFHGEGNYYIYRNGQLEIFPQLGQDYFEPLALNNAGCVAGTIYYSNSFSRAVLYKEGSFHFLGLPGVKSEAADINNRGLIVGRSGGAGAFFTLNKAETLEGMSEALRVNDRGDIVGWGEGFFRIFSGVARFKNKKQIPLPFSPTGINDHGQIVGKMFDPDTYAYLRPVIYVRGVIHDLNDLIEPGTARLSYVYDINDRGQIVGWGTGANGNWSGLLLTPSNPSKEAR